MLFFVKICGTVVIVSLVISRVRGIIGESDNLSRHLTFDIVIILYGIDDHLGGYYLTGEGDIRLGSADDSAFLVLIIILLFSKNVNRTDDGQLIR